MKKTIILIIILLSFWFTNKGQLNKIIIWENIKNLSEKEKKISIFELKQLYFEYEDWIVTIKSKNKKLLKNLKIQTFDYFPQSINLNLNQEIKCQENEELLTLWWFEWIANWCVKKWYLPYKFDWFEEDNYLMWSILNLDKCLFNFDFCETNPYESFTNISYFDYYKWDLNWLTASLKQYKDILIIDIYKNDKYIKSEIFFVNKKRGIILLINLLDENSKRFIETMKFPINEKESLFIRKFRKFLNSYNYWIKK